MVEGIGKRPDMPIQGGMNPGNIGGATGETAAGMKDLRIKLYPDGRHEMHNEINREELRADVLAFLDEALSK